MAVRQFAAIDVGSYELEMVIYDISPKKGLTRVDHIRHVLALGRDTYRYGKISVELIDELCETLSDFLEIMKSYGVTEYKAYATSALREAKNREIVLDQIRVRSGVEVHVLSNSEQRFLFYKALAAGNKIFEEMIQQGTVLVDVGFGSLQISLYDHGSLITTQNIRLGALRIREMLTDSEGNTLNINRLIEELVEHDIETFRRLFLKDIPVKNIIGIGNNILYLLRSTVSAGADTNHDGIISVEEFERFYSYMMTKSPAQISEEYNIPTDYATLLFPGTMVYKRVLDLTRAEEIWAPTITLCDGVATDFAEREKMIELNHDFSNDIISAAHAISARYVESTAHTTDLDEHVCLIFDTMKKYHGMNRREKLLLRIAAILHDCGKYVSMSSAGESAYQIIMATEIIGLSHREREIVANVVRFNTSEYHPGIIAAGGGQTLKRSDEILILKMTAILRVANALDRSHRQKFKHISIRQKDKELVITADTSADISLERGLFSQKADFFEEVYGIRPVLKRKKGAK